MAKRRTLKVSTALEKLQELKEVFGEDSKIVEFAQDTIMEKMGAVDQKYRNKDGSVNPRKLEKAYDDQQKLVKSLEDDLEHLKGDAGARGTRAIYKEKLKVEKATLNALKGNVYLTGVDLMKSLQTPRQLLTSEIKNIKEQYKSGETTSKMDEMIAKSKTQKSVLENDEAVKYLRERANYTAQLANMFDELYNKVYEMGYKDPDVSETDRDKAKELLEWASYTPGWLDAANQLVGAHYEDMIARDWARLVH